MNGGKGTVNVFAGSVNLTKMPQSLPGSWWDSMTTSVSRDSAKLLKTLTDQFTDMVLEDVTEM